MGTARARDWRALTRQRTYLTATKLVSAKLEKKATKLGYQSKIRLAYLGDSQTSAKLRMQAISRYVQTVQQHQPKRLQNANEQLQKRRSSKIQSASLLATGDLSSISKSWPRYSTCRTPTSRHQTSSGQATKPPNHQPNCQL